MMFYSLDQIWPGLQVVANGQKSRQLLTDILEDMAACVEFLQGDQALAWEYKDIPVLIPHVARDAMKYKAEQKVKGKAEP